MITLEVQGLEGSQQMLKMLEFFANMGMGIELNARHRFGEDGEEDEFDITNADILDFLDEQGRNFVDPPPVHRMDKAQMKAIEKGVKSIPKRMMTKKTNMKRLVNSAKRGLSSNLQRLAREQMARGLRAAAKEWKKEITRRIEQGDWTGGGGDLNPEYEAEKLRAVGFAHPIGKRTGQLIDNVAPNTRNLKIIKYTK